MTTETRMVLDALSDPVVQGVIKLKIGVSNKDVRIAVREIQDRIEEVSPRDT